jgi:hypothetical protein
MNNNYMYVVVTIMIGLCLYSFKESFEAPPDKPQKLNYITVMPN